MGCWKGVQDVLNKVALERSLAPLKRGIDSMLKNLSKDPRGVGAIGTDMRNCWSNRKDSGVACWSRTFFTSQS